MSSELKSERRDRIRRKRRHGMQIRGRSVLLLAELTRAESRRLRKKRRKPSSGSEFQPAGGSSSTTSK